MLPAEGTLSLRHAVALGLLQGPTELLPVSSSAHTSLLPWLAGWRYAQLNAEWRKSFEVALHAGAGAALAIDMRGELWRAAKHMDGRTAAMLALSLAPPVLAGFTLRDRIERRFGGPRSIAFGLTAGGLAMALADRGGTGTGAGEDTDTGMSTSTSTSTSKGAHAGREASARGCEDARALDGLALGLAQASALMPGVSRNGATLTAARARGFSRGASHALSWAVALPVIMGASVLKGSRLRGAGAPRGTRAGLAAGALSAFASTWLSAGLLRRGRAGGRALWPYSLYRCVLAGVVVTRVRRAQ